MKLFWNWLRRKLGIRSLERRQEISEKAIGRIENKIRLRKRPMRYDEIERARKRRKKQLKKA